MMQPDKANGGINELVQQSAKQQQQHNNVSKLYDKIRVLGRGSYGLASLHRRRCDRVLVVLKEIDLLKFKGDSERLSAINEVEIMSSLDHPNIIKYFNAFATESRLIIEMEYANFGTLATYISLQNDQLEMTEILIIFRQLTSGLNYLHDKNIIHLDLKMENIFLTNDGLIKIGDFGIAKHLQNNHQGQQESGDNFHFRLNNNNSKSAKEQLQLNNNDNDHQNESNDLATTKINKDNNLNICQSISGVATTTTNPFQCTLAYSSPERCLGEPCDYKSDIWSLGCVLYELITSKQLFDAASIAQLVLNITQISYTPIQRDVPENLKHLFELMISQDPNQRPTAKQLCSSTTQLLTSWQNDRIGTPATSKLKTQRRMSSAGQLESTGSGFWKKFATGNQHNNNQNNGNNESPEVSMSDPDQRIDGNNQQHQQLDVEQLQQLLYPHSLIYQVSLGFSNIKLNRICLPQSKRIREIAGGKSHTLALTYDNIVFGWGSRGKGQLGSCITISRQQQQQSGSSSIATKNISDPSVSSNSLVFSNNTKPIVVISELNHRKIIQVAAGKDFSVFLSKTGIVMTCGDATSGCLGHGDYTSCSKPRMVESLLNKDVSFIAAGSKHVIAVCGNGDAYAWGLTSSGRLGIGNHQSSICNTPTLVNFRAKVAIKAAFCGPKSTIFIDSNDKCWACGNNANNKLGLDVVKRFKRTKLIEFESQPRSIDCLAKTSVKSCSISKHHSTFTTLDGTILVLGRDTDHAFELDIYRQTDKRSFEHQFLSNLVSTNNSANQLTEMFKPENVQEAKKEKPHRDEQLKLDGKQPRWKRREWESHIKSYRSLRKMPFEMGQSVALSSQFSLVLTNENRIYFWGTRSYRKDLDAQNYCLSREKLQRQKDYEPPIIDSSQKDDCFIKIAHTNKSFMQSMQQIGSDQPILHVQDPRLVVKKMSDLWILDYQMAQLDMSLESQNHSLNSSIASTSLVASTTAKNEVKQNDDNISLSSDCSCCIKTESCDASLISGSSCSCCSAATSCCSNDKLNLISDHCDIIDKLPKPEETTKKQTDPVWRHDVILEPQPIVSLYVPSMFSHQLSSLRIAKIYCFANDRFYLVLETTYRAGTTMRQSPKPNTLSARPQVVGAGSSSKNNGNKNSGNSAAVAIKQPLAEVKRSFRPRRSSLPIELDRSPNHLSIKLKDLRMKFMGNVNGQNDATTVYEATKNDSNNHGKLLVAGSADQAIKLGTIDCGSQLGCRSQTIIVGEVGKDDSLAINGDAEDANQQDDDNITISSGNRTENLTSDGNNKQQAVASSLGISLDEPRSFSTFANQFDESQIVIGPSKTDRNLAGAADGSREQSSPGNIVVVCGGGGGDSGGGADTEPQKHFFGDAFSRLRRVAKGRRGQVSEPSARNRKRLKNSFKLQSGNQETNNEVTEDATTTTTNTSTNTSMTISMPSWVCNEYIMHKKQMKKKSNHRQEEMEQHQDQIDEKEQEEGELEISNSRRYEDLLDNQVPGVDDTIFRIDTSSETKTNSEISNDRYTEMTEIDCSNRFIRNGQTNIMPPMTDSTLSINLNGEHRPMRYNESSQTMMMLTCDIPEVLRPRAKSFGESNGTVFDGHHQQSKQYPNQHHHHKTSASKSNTKTTRERTNENNNKRRQRPRSLNASQQLITNELMMGGNTNWHPSGLVGGQNLDFFGNLRPLGGSDQFMRASQSSSRALTEIDPMEHQHRPLSKNNDRPTTSQNGGGSNLSLASLRNSIIKLFK